MNLKVTEYIQDKNKWTQELKLLRSALQELPLEEDIKWGIPAYLYKGKNIIGMSAFKNYCGLWFHQGIFLKDENKLLMNAQEGKTKAMRQWRFNSLKDIDVELVKSYALEAIDNAEKGKAIKPQKNKTPIIIPQQLQNELDSNSLLLEKFDSFSLSKQREYVNYLIEAKRETTKQKRLEKITPMILKGIGLHDKYRK
ncbi:YdeI/OmpD-associated family protein [Tenacibaculum halocynthiae]|uniref:YdeI/OmpD-associated family protein n=1 Tax=Tenacibaculum halocynthiae TaxID=1254437 RepID=UPI003D6609B6